MLGMVIDRSVSNSSDLSLILKAFDRLVSNTVFTPNGIVYDPAQDRLVVVAWGANAAITEVDKETGVMSTLTTTALTNIDGITIDCNGNFLVASWTPAAITRFESTFTQPGVTVSTAGALVADPLAPVTATENAAPFWDTAADATM